MGVGVEVKRGRTRLPKFKFLAKFPIGLHVILQNADKKDSELSTILCAKLFYPKNLLVVQPCNPLEQILNEYRL